MVRNVGDVTEAGIIQQPENTTFQDFSNGSNNSSTIEEVVDEDVESVNEIPPVTF